jgi:hypothetical protein
MHDAISKMFKKLLAFVFVEQLGYEMEPFKTQWSCLYVLATLDIIFSSHIHL